MGFPYQPDELDETPVAVMGETGEEKVPVPVPGAEEVSLGPRGELGIENGGDVPLKDVLLDNVNVELVVKVDVSVSGNVMVVRPVLGGAVGAVLGGAVSLHGVG